MLDRSHFCGKCGTYKRYDPVRKRRVCPRCRHGKVHEELVHGRRPADAVTASSQNTI
ncbi:MAG: hypothetical protein ACUVV6_09210 [Thermoplasmatota archaeon]